MSTIRLRNTALTICVVGGVSAFAASGPAQSQPADWPATVKAKYEVSFAGIDIGSFWFNSRVGRGDYKLNGTGKLSLLFGALKWRGKAESVGQAARDMPSPHAFKFKYRRKSKTRSVEMTMRDGAVVSVEQRPNRRPSRRAVPVRPEHTRDVLDPLSAVMALTRLTDRHPCERTLSVFDGKQRFDLRFSRRSGGWRAGSQRRIVCGVKYIPVSGHKPSRGVKFMAANDKMEVTLKPVPEAGVAIPVEVRVPTIGGDAVLAAKRVKVTTVENRMIMVSK